jgi:hypothetical protein
LIDVSAAPQLSSTIVSFGGSAASSRASAAPPSSTSTVVGILRIQLARTRSLGGNVRCSITIPLGISPTTPQDPELDQLGESARQPAQRGGNCDPGWANLVRSGEVCLT